jgi:hypothetical protein
MNIHDAITVVLALMLVLFAGESIKHGSLRDYLLERSIYWKVLAVTAAISTITLITLRAFGYPR